MIGRSKNMAAGWEPVAPSVRTISRPPLSRLSALAKEHRGKEAKIPGVPARVAQDIRGYYETAALAIADHTPAAWAGLRWFRDSTQAGKVIRAAQQAMKDAEVRRDLWFFLLPMDSMQS